MASSDTHISGKLGHLREPTFITSNNAPLTGDLFMKDVAGYFLSHFGLSPVCQRVHGILWEYYKDVLVTNYAYIKTMALLY